MDIRLVWTSLRWLVGMVLPVLDARRLLKRYADDWRSPARVHENGQTAGGPPSSLTVMTFRMKAMTVPP